eukprot:357854-Chlamydomonas_euryale.AAC.2
MAYARTHRTHRRGATTAISTLRFRLPEQAAGQVALSKPGRQTKPKQGAKDTTKPGRQGQPKQGAKDTNKTGPSTAFVACNQLQSMPSLHIRPSPPR